MEVRLKWIKLQTCEGEAGRGTCGMCERADILFYKRERERERGKLKNGMSSLDTAWLISDLLRTRPCTSPRGLGLE